MVYAIYAPVYGEFTKIDQGTVVDLAAFVIRNGARLSIFGIATTTTNHAIKPPSTAPAKRKSDFCTPAPKLDWATIKVVTTDVESPGQLRA